MREVVAGRPSAVWLHAQSAIPPDTALTLWLRGPKTYRGVVAEREAPTVNIEARFAVRVSGEYTLIVEDASKRALLRDKLRVVAGPAHTASCSLDDQLASPDGRHQILLAVDAFGNRHVAGGASFFATCGRQLRCDIKDLLDGTYAVTLPPAAQTAPASCVWQPKTDPGALVTGGADGPGEDGGGVPLGGEGEVAEMPIFIRRPPEKAPVSATCELVGGAMVGRALGTCARARERKEARNIGQMPVLVHRARTLCCRRSTAA